MTITEINALLRAVNPQYSARFVEADDFDVDDEIRICFAGAPTRWTMQIGHDYVGINEYKFDTAGNVQSSKCRGFCRDLTAATIRLCVLLIAEVSGVTR